MPPLSVIAFCVVLQALLQPCSSAPVVNDLQREACSACPRGYGVTSPCSEVRDTGCALCSGRFYSNLTSTTESCLACSKCGKHLFELQSCNATHDVFCELCLHTQHMDNLDFIKKCSDEITRGKKVKKYVSDVLDVMLGDQPAAVSEDVTGNDELKKETVNDASANKSLDINKEESLTKDPLEKVPEKDYLREPANEVSSQVKEDEAQTTVENTAKDNESVEEDPQASILKATASTDDGGVGIPDSEDIALESTQAPQNHIDNNISTATNPLSNLKTTIPTDNEGINEGISINDAGNSVIEGTQTHQNNIDSTGKESTILIDNLRTTESSDTSSSIVIDATYITDTVDRSIVDGLGQASDQSNNTKEAIDSSNDPSSSITSSRPDTTSETTYETDTEVLTTFKPTPASNTSQAAPEIKNQTFIQTTSRVSNSRDASAFDVINEKNTTILESIIMSTSQPFSSQTYDLNYVNVTQDATNDTLTHRIGLNDKESLKQTNVTTATLEEKDDRISTSVSSEDELFDGITTESNNPTTQKTNVSIFKEPKQRNSTQGYTLPSVTDSVWTGSATTTPETTNITIASYDVAGDQKHVSESSFNGTGSWQSGKTGIEASTALNDSSTAMDATLKGRADDGGEEEMRGTFAPTEDGVEPHNGSILLLGGGNTDEVNKLPPYTGESTEDDGIPILAIVMVIVTSGLLFFLIGFLFYKRRGGRLTYTPSRKYKKANSSQEMKPLRSRHPPPFKLSKDQVNGAPESASNGNVVSDRTPLYPPAPDSEPVGNNQSPVDINPEAASLDETLEKHPLAISYAPKNARTLTNTGSTVRLNYESIGTTLSGGPFEDKKYSLDHIDFHWGSSDSTGSEHTVLGQHYPLEIQLVHWRSDTHVNYSSAENASASIAILSVFGEIGTRHQPTLKKLTDCLPSIQHMAESRGLPGGQCDARRLLPDKLCDYWTYTGSRTTPPYTENVTWVVFKDPIQVSPDQLSRFRKLKQYERGEGHGRKDLESYIQDNFRDVMPLNNRHIYASFA